jgi:ion channel-forming bestrophin family protein
MIDYNPKNWLLICLQLRGSVLPRLLPRTLIAAVFGTAAAYLHAKTGFQFPAIAHTMIGVALGLLLVFRTNTSYDRFWEGRKLLGQIVNRTRDLARQVATLIESSDAEAALQKSDLQRLITALYGLIRQNLRAERDLSQLGTELTSEQSAALGPVANRPLVAASWISKQLVDQVRAGRLTEQRLQLMDSNLTSIIDAWGGGQRIQNTPVPFAYAQHIKIFVVVFAFTVPFAMVESLDWYTPLAAAILAFALFGIDEIGVEIEEPFGYDANDLPLDRIGNTIANDTAAVVQAHGAGRAEPPAAQ